MRIGGEGKGPNYDFRIGVTRHEFRLATSSTFDTNLFL
jgi:hypothetical protein